MSFRWLPMLVVLFGLVPVGAEAQGRAQATVSITVVEAGLTSAPPSCAGCEASHTAATGEAPVVTLEWSGARARQTLGATTWTAVPAATRAHLTREGGVVTTVVVVP